MARAPEVFTIAPDKPATRKPAARNPGGGDVEIVDSTDVFTAPTVVADDMTPPRGNGWLRVLVAATTGFIGLAVGFWVYELVVDLLARWPVLGYAALGLVATALLALAVLAAREIAALMRLGSAETLRKAGDAALEDGTAAAAQAFIGRISGFYQNDVTTARARAALDDYRREIIDGKDLIRLAERELLGPKDEAARAAIASAASRVAMVTTLSPRAWVDVVFVLVQGLKLIGRVATLYNGRPGGLATWRLSARVLTHLAITGGVAVAQDALGQFIGAGLAGRLSSKLGEGVLNGVLTARVGLSAIAVCRPMRFRELAAPSLSDVAGSLIPLGGEREKTAG